MKKVALLSAVICCVFSANAQEKIVKFPYDSISKEVVYTEVITTTLKKEKLFSNAKIWLATNLKSYKTSVDFEDLSTRLHDALLENYVVIGKNSKAWLATMTNCFATTWGRNGHINGLVFDEEFVNVNRSVFSSYDEVKLDWITESKMLHFSHAVVPD